MTTLDFKKGTKGVTLTGKFFDFEKNPLLLKDYKELEIVIKFPHGVENTLPASPINNEFCNECKYSDDLSQDSIWTMCGDYSYHFRVELNDGRIFFSDPELFWVT